jgi:purine-nucleoside phosphorylase
MQTVRETLDRALVTLRGRFEAPRVAVVLGSGLGALADDLADRNAVPYATIPGMPVSKVAGHAGNLVFGRIETTPIVAMQGRVHLYEGHPACDVVFGARLMIALGAQSVIITNAAGGIDASFTPGDLMIIDDHLNLTATSCLVGANDESMGPRFPDMTQAYDRELRERAEDVAKKLGFEIRHGVYAGLLGPTYETPAEVRMLRTLGANAVGMSTVLETIAARHMGARVLGISCITNLAAGLGSGELTHDEVKETADRVRDRFVGLVRGVCAGL